MNQNSRREFLKSLGLAAAGFGITGSVLSSCSTKPSSQQSATSDSTTMVLENKKEMFFKISLAEWSFNKALKEGKMNHLDFPGRAKNEFDISAVEYVNQFFMDRAKDNTYLAELKKRCDDNGVTSVLIMCDHEGSMGDLNSKKRLQTVENHYKWAEAAKFLGCHSIRVNCAGEGTPDEVSKAGTEGLHKLSEFAQTLGINVIVENHGGMSSNGQWLSKVIANVGLPNCGTLPDFGNFCIREEKKKENGIETKVCLDMYDRYKGVAELLPFAKGVSAKAEEFDAAGNCVETDYYKMLPIVKQNGYTGYIGIEYEGKILSPEDGIRATKNLLEKVGRSLS